MTSYNATILKATGFKEGFPQETSFWRGEQSEESPPKFFELFQFHNDVNISTAKNYGNDYDFANLTAVEGIVPPDFSEVIEAWVWVENTSSTGTGVSLGATFDRIAEGDTSANSYSGSVTEDFGSTSRRWKVDITELFTENPPEPGESIGARLGNGSLTLRCIEGGVLYQ